MAAGTATQSHNQQRSAQLRIGRFVVRRWLGGGAHGKVFLAHDPLLERQVAIKWLKAGSLPDEARILAALEHPNIVPLYEAGEHLGAPYLVFAYVQGTTLRQRLRHLQRAQGPLQVPQALALIGAILDGVACAHARGVLHLDLSPGNIMIDAAGVPRVMDFGLARLAAQAAARFEGCIDADFVTGTPRYMTPEHFRGQPLTARTDVFALGLLLYEMLAGRSPVRSNSLDGLIDEVGNNDLELGALDSPGIDPRLHAVVRRALRRDPGRRFADAGGMRAALEELLETNGLAGMHSTVKFLLKRMQRKANFPALSNSLLEINRLTGEHSSASTDALANVVLRDYAIAKKLLKLANSSFYASRGGVKTVSEAIRLLGMNVVRMACNGLVFFDALKGGDRNLREALVSSFVSALLGRHFALRLGRPDLAEEAFICCMFHRLGRSLTIFYFEEEFLEIERLVAQAGISDEDASARVLGVGYGGLGMAVAEQWKFPEAICASIQSPGPGRLPGPASPEQLQQQIAAFSNELCELVTRASADQAEARLEGFCARFAGLIAITPEELGGLLQAAFRKLEEFAPVLGVDLAGSGFAERVGKPGSESTYFALRSCRAVQGQ